jgi:CPA2 family monovalent cation:H+ antiporter-2
VGLHFSVADLMAVRRIALPGAVVQIVVATALGAALAGSGLGHRGQPGLRLSLSVASTVVLIRALEQRHLPRRPTDGLRSAG